MKISMGDLKPITGLEIPKSVDYDPLLYHAHKKARVITTVPMKTN